MCGGCNVFAESAGVSLIVARYWWVARQGRRAVAEAESIARHPEPVTAGDGFVDPIRDVTRLVRS